MPALRDADNRRRPEAHGLETAAVGQLDEPGVYLTNEVFLYRVIGGAASSEDETVELEDCYGLDVVRVPATDLRARGLRAVTAASSGD